MAPTSRPGRVPPLALGFVVLMTLSAVGCTIVPDKPKDTQGGTSEKLGIDSGRGFKPDEYVAGIWDGKVLPYFKSKGAPFSQILPLWAKDKDAAGKAFGYREKGEGSPWNIVATGAGVVLSVDTASAASTMSVDLEPPDGKADLVIQIGPVIKGTSIRDSLPFISFAQFTNQLEFAELSNALHKKVMQTVLNGLNREGLVGRQVTFRGVFTQVDGSDEVRLTPVELEVK